MVLFWNRDFFLFDIAHLLSHLSCVVPQFFHKNKDLSGLINLEFRINGFIKGAPFVPARTIADPENDLKWRTLRISVYAW